MPRPRSIVCAVLACALLAASAAASAAPPRATSAKACADARLAPSSKNLARIRRATLCLLNVERTKRGLVALRRDSRLTRASRDHSIDMVRNRYFEHDSPSGSTVVTRLRKVHYIANGIAWSVGENIAYGGGSAATPRSIVRLWMGSSGHRANILSNSFRDIGIGVARGTPSGSHGGATYTTDFGRRG